MKKFVITLALTLFNTYAFANSVKVEIVIPESTQQVVLTAKNVVFDECNDYHLDIFQQSTHNPPVYHVGVAQTEMGCGSDKTSSGDLTSIISLPNGAEKPSSIILESYLNDFHHLKVELK